MTNEIETVWFHDGIKVDHIDSFTSELYIDGFLAKRYNGETAWMDAERDAYDLAVKRMYQ